MGYSVDLQRFQLSKCLFGSQFTAVKLTKVDIPSITPLLLSQLLCVLCTITLSHCVRTAHNRLVLEHSVLGLSADGGYSRTMACRRQCNQLVKISVALA